MDNTVKNTLSSSILDYQSSTYSILTLVLPYALVIATTVILLYFGYKIFLQLSNMQQYTFEYTPSHKPLEQMTGSELEQYQGWPKGVKQKFDYAMLTKNKKDLNRYMYYAPMEYKHRFETEIKGILAGDAESSKHETTALFKGTKEL